MNPSLKDPPPTTPTPKPIFYAYVAARKTEVEDIRVFIETGFHLVNALPVPWTVDYLGLSRHSSWQMAKTVLGGLNV